MILSEFFREHPRAALGFSGGVDSAYLLWAALGCGAEVRPYFVRSPFQPEFELRDAKRLCGELGAELTVIELVTLAVPEIAENGPERCYHCKKTIFSAIARRAAADGFALLLDGANASDDASDRPGMRAVGELGVRSPLRECALTKAEIRRLSREAGLFTWDKPANACLATRVPTGTPLTRAALETTEQAENALRGLGFRDFRVRWRAGGETALLQFSRADMERYREQSPRAEELLRQFYQTILVDEELRHG